MTSAIGSSFGSTFPTPGVAPARGGTQPEILNEELRRGTEARAPEARPADEAAETRRPVDAAAREERSAAFTAAAPTEEQVRQARDSGQTRGGFLDIQA